MENSLYAYEWMSRVDRKNKRHATVVHSFEPRLQESVPCRQIAILISPIPTWVGVW
ncbi:hypothetical protein APX70_01315 [Pseudomonas syringae pv. maculicola]|uniref:Uncharacterized protein n=2 Tax=Pseudomonas syringae group TaxID=136849 RepID=A0A3M2VM28_PSEYM|nr:hypothetical protein APX70_01315 [Pseudomonas syringae pv. maculicola]